MILLDTARQAGPQVSPPYGLLQPGFGSRCRTSLQTFKPRIGIGAFKPVAASLEGCQLCLAAVPVASSQLHGCCGVLPWWCAVASSQFNLLTKLHNRQTGSDRQMQQASKEIGDICERLRLPDTVRNSALEVFRDVSVIRWQRLPTGCHLQ